MWSFLIGSVLLVTVVSAAPYFDGRIVNGTDAELNEFPFAVSLRSASGSHMCGASLISPEWVLTAAHCIGSTDPQAYTLQYGVNDITPTGSSIAFVSQVIVHKGFDYNKLINDIALLKLYAPLEFNNTVYAVNLPKHQNVTAGGGSNATLIGWGLNSSSGIIMKRLQKVDLSIVAQPDCARIHSLEVHWSNICAGVPGGGKGQCSGDSGGPLLVNGTQYGVVSWSMKPCTIAPYPGVFTDVSAFRDWITENSGV